MSSKNMNLSSDIVFNKFLNYPKNLPKMIISPNSGTMLLSFSTLKLEIFKLIMT